MILRTEYIISGSLYEEALDYTEKSKLYTSNTHNFHAGELDNKKPKMFKGKLGEKAFKLFSLKNNISFEKDYSKFNERDEFDFLIFTAYKDTLKIDVKTKTKHFHIHTLEMVEQAESHPKDIFVSARLFANENKVKLLGWYTFDNMINANRIENNGYRSNYVMYDNELRPLETLLEYFRT